LPSDSLYNGTAQPVHAKVGQKVQITLSGWSAPRVSSGRAVLVATGRSSASRAAFRAVRPGTATVTAHSSSAQWTLTVEVTR
jgi:hypothetical protein